MPAFLRTPLEIRNQIYEYLLSTGYTRIGSGDEEPVSDGSLTALTFCLKQH